jgi:hypothetical protein
MIGTWMQKSRANDQLSDMLFTLVFQQADQAQELSWPIAQPQKFARNHRIASGSQSRQLKLPPSRRRVNITCCSVFLLVQSVLSGGAVMCGK